MRNRKSGRSWFEFSTGADRDLGAFITTDIVPDDAVDNLDVTFIRAIQASAISHTSTAGNLVVDYCTIRDYRFCEPVHRYSAAVAAGSIKRYQTIVQEGTVIEVLVAAAEVDAAAGSACLVSGKDAISYING